MNEQEISEIIERIKSRRQEMGLSYQDMQDLTGISKSTWQRYETGYIKNLGIDKLDLVAKALKTTPAYLMGWTKNDGTNKSVNEESFLGEFKTAEEATAFLLKQPALAAYGGYDLKKMSDEEIIEFANELLMQLQLLSYKYKK